MKVVKILQVSSLLWLVAVTITEGCGGKLTSLTGTIRSPNFPNNYTNGLNCVYVITVPANYRITLTFWSMDIEPNSNCSLDYVEVRDGDKENSPNLGLFCGTRVRVTLRTFTNHMWIKFSTNPSVGRAGFNATYNSAVLPDSQILIASTAGIIIRIDPETFSNYAIPFPGPLFNPIAVDYDPVERRIYWTEVGLLNFTRCSNIDGSGVRLVRDGGHNAILDGIAVDPLSRLIFYTDAGNDIIAMLSMTTFAYRTVISSSLDRPRAIVLDPINGVMFWTDWGALPRIERANYDGSDRRTLVDSFLYHTNALALDVANNRLYWADGYTDRVEMSDLDGNGRTLLYEFKEQNMVFGMALFQNSLYMTDWGAAGSRSNFTRIFRLNLATRNVSFLGSMSDRMNGIAAYHQPSSKTFPNGCATNNGSCSVFCIPLPDNHSKCMCPDGQYLSDDQVSCDSEPTRYNSSDTTVLPTSSKYSQQPQQQTHPETKEGLLISTTHIIIASVIAGAAVIIVVTIVIVVVIVKRKRSDKSSAKESRQDSWKNQTDSDISRPPFNINDAYNLNEARNPYNSFGTDVSEDVYAELEPTVSQK